MNYSGQDTFFFNVASVGLFLIGQRLVVVLTEEIQLTSAGSRQLVRLDSILDVMLNFLYNTIQHYLEHLKVIKMISRDLQQKINTSMENKHLIQMFNLSESLVYYAYAINSNNSVLTRLRSHAEKTGMTPQTIDLIDDLIIENNQCYKQAEIYTTVFSGLMDARGTLVNNNMNVLLKNLTIINVFKNNSPLLARDVYYGANGYISRLQKELGMNYEDATSAVKGAVPMGVTAEAINSVFESFADELSNQIEKSFQFLSSMGGEPNFS